VWGISCQGVTYFISHSKNSSDNTTCDFAVVDLCDDEKTINQEAWLGASSHEILLFIEVNILLKKRLNLVFTF
jgi:hypothetical protein